MRIGLIKVDGHNYINLALGKLATWHKSQGYSVEWADPMFGEYDKVYASKIFNFSPDFTDIYECEIVKGGTGYDIHSKLPDYVDCLQPDYSMFPEIDSKTAYGFTTRGCIRKCPWCAVPKAEGYIRPYIDVEEIAMGGVRTKLILMDNNILACDHGLEQIEKIIKKQYRIDLNQASDARLITNDIAKMFAQVRWLAPIRLGCDTPQQIIDCERAMAMIDKHCEIPRQYLLYMMIHGDINECYERLSRYRNHKRIRIVAQPFRDVDNPNHHPPQWQRDMARWAMRREFYATCDFKDFSPRKGFKCSEYFK